MFTVLLFILSLGSHEKQKTCSFHILVPEAILFFQDSTSYIHSNLPINFLATDSPGYLSQFILMSGYYSKHILNFRGRHQNLLGATWFFKRSFFFLLPLNFHDRCLSFHLTICLPKLTWYTIPLNAFPVLCLSPKDHWYRHESNKEWLYER